MSSCSAPPSRHPTRSSRRFRHRIAVIAATAFSALWVVYRYFLPAAIEAGRIEARKQATMRTLNILAISTKALHQDQLGKKELLTDDLVHLWTDELFLASLAGAQTRVDITSGRVLDGWGSPILLQVNSAGGGLTFQSYGPDKADDRCGDDDLCRWVAVPAESEVRPR